jgi:hypothetical protein
MKIRRREVSMKEQLEDAIAEIGGEPLDGSGFEKETPDEGFSGAALAPSTLLPSRPKASH